MKNWTKEAIFYHIYPFGFCNTPKQHQDEIVNRIQKISEWIPHLKTMHINALYMGPVFESFEHGYDTSDYQVVDHRLGTNEDLIRVCEQLQSQQIRVVFDGVFNHVGRNFWAFRDVLENKQNSRYCDWFSNINFAYGSPMGDSFTYDAWEGHYNLVKLNLKNEEVITYLLESVGMWIEKFHISGLRLDAADCIDKNFFRRLKQFCLERDEDFWLMGEIIHGNYNDWVRSDLLDSVTNYECYKGLYSSHNEKNYFEIAHSLQRQFGKGGIYQNLTLYNFVDNHDVNRLASTLSSKEDLCNVYTLLYTMPGIPSVYYGSEWAVRGQKHDGSDQDIRASYSLDEMLAQDQALCKHIAMLGQIKCEYPLISYGRYEQIILTNEHFVFARKDDKTAMQIALNTGAAPFIYEMKCSNVLLDVCTKKEYHPKNGMLQISIPAKSSCVLFPLEKAKSEYKEVDIPTPHIPIEKIPTKEPASLTNIVPGRYQHFKGKHYAVIYTAKHSETLEEYVVYRQLYGEGKVWVRPLTMFQEHVLVDGKEVKRFQYIGK